MCVRASLCADATQAKWLLWRHQREQRRLKEQQFAAWAAEHYAAAVAGHASVAADASTAQQGSSDSEDAEDPAASGRAPGGQDSTGWRRSRVTGEDSTAKPAKPIVQPWARMVGREVPLLLSTNAAAAPPTAKWRGAVSGAMAANKLSALGSAAAADGAGEQAAAASGVVLEEVPVMQADGADGPAALAGSLPRCGFIMLNTHLHHPKQGNLH